MLENLPENLKTAGNLFLKVMVRGTSKHWSYHTDLTDFCLKFRLSFVCGYLNYYCENMMECFHILYLVKLQAGYYFTIYYWRHSDRRLLIMYQLWRCRLSYTFNMDSKYHKLSSCLYALSSIDND